jgi:DNA polymerase-3 subunit delta'
VSTDPDIESDQQAGCLHPRDRYDLIGHDRAETDFANAWASGNFHHAWLITGPKGVGKASLAWRAARRALGANPASQYGILGSAPDDPVCRLFESQACADLLVLRRPWDEKRKRWRAEITVDEARKAPKFFEKTAGAGGWRACIVDGIDDMNNNAANALLKTLEEPPARGVLFLISHSPGQLKATIRSRCRRLDLRAPNQEKTVNWLTNSANGIDPEQAASACKMANNAPGRALELAMSGGVSMSRTVDSLVGLGTRASPSEVRALAERVSARNADGLREVFYECLARSMHHRARTRATAGDDPTSWLDAAAQLQALVRDADNIYLDARQSALSALNLAREAARKENA